MDDRVINEGQRSITITSDDEGQDEWEVASEAPITPVEDDRSRDITRHQLTREDRDMLQGSEERVYDFGTPPFGARGENDSDEPPRLMPATADLPRYMTRVRGNRYYDDGASAVRWREDQDRALPFRLQEKDVMLNELRHECRQMREEMEKMRQAGYTVEGRQQPIRHSSLVSDEPRYNAGRLEPSGGFAAIDGRSSRPRTPEPFESAKSAPGTAMTVETAALKNNENYVGLNSRLYNTYRAGSGVDPADGRVQKTPQKFDITLGFEIRVRLGLG